jgi:putative aldouronate transport system substrate-binding protein
MMNRWYNEGIFDRDFFVRTGEERNAAIANGEIIAFSDGRGATWNNLNNGRAVNPDFDLVQIPGLALNRGETVQARQRNSFYKGNDTVVTTNCLHPERAVEFLNFGYTERGYLLYNYGIEGITYEFVGNEMIRTPLVLDDDVVGPWGQIQLLYRRHVPPALISWDSNPVNEYFHHINAVWSSAGIDLLMPPRVSHTEAESLFFAPTMTDIDTYLSENVVQLITGDRPLSDYDSFVNDLLNMGIERAIEIQQAATDRFEANRNR